MSYISRGGYAREDTRCRYVVYFLRDAASDVVYVGRSCDVAGRIKAHYSDATHPFDLKKREQRAWIFDVRSVDMVGPFLWHEAVRREREEIESRQPRGNIALTDRDTRRRFRSGHLAAAAP